MRLVRCGAVGGIVKRPHVVRVVLYFSERKRTRDIESAVLSSRDIAPKGNCGGGFAPNAHPSASRLSQLETEIIETESHQSNPASNTLRPERFGRDAQSIAFAGSNLAATVVAGTLVNLFISLRPWSFPATLVPVLLTAAIVYKYAPSARLRQKATRNNLVAASPHLHSPPKPSFGRW